MIRLLLVVVSLGLVGGCACCTAARPSSTTAGLPPRPARINHLAFFKLHDPGDAEALIADCDRLAQLPGIVSYYAGTHYDMGRATVDGDYDVGFFIGFMHEEDLANYVTHPVHVELVEKWRPRWQWIRVHDVIDDSP